MDLQLRQRYRSSIVDVGLTYLNPLRDASDPHGRIMPCEETPMTTTRRRLIPVLPCLMLAAVVISYPSPQGSPVRAAQATPAASPTATYSGRYLPAAEAIGAGWALVSTGAPEADPAVFVDAASAVYVGPDGARVAVTAWTNVAGRAGVQRSWEAVGAIYADLRFEVTGPKDEDREEELAELPLPSGCVDARRIDGLDPLYGLPGAITQCTVEPDVNVLVIVSGAVDGVSGYEASDRLATLAAQAGSG